MTNGKIAVFSPTALIPEAKEAVDQLGGNVGYIAAMDIEHHIFLGPWHAAYPNATVIGVEGLPEKRASQQNENVPFGVVFTKKDKSHQKVDEAFDQDFDYEYFDAHMNREIIFNYKPERTLIEADALYNLPATEQYSKAGVSAESGTLTKVFNFFQNTAGTAIWQKRFMWYVAAKDKPSFSASAQRVASWDFERIIPCHGDVIETGGMQVFRKLFEWYLNGKH